MNRSYLTTVRRLTIAKHEKTKTGLKEPAPLNQPVSNQPVAQNQPDESQQGWGDPSFTVNQPWEAPNTVEWNTWGSPQANQSGWSGRASPVNPTMPQNTPASSQGTLSVIPPVSMMNQQTGPSNQQAGPSNQPPVVLPNTYYNPYVSFGTLPSQQMYGNYGPPGPYIGHQPVPDQN